MDIYSLLITKPHNIHYLNKYWKFIQYCKDKNSNAVELGTKITNKHHICPKGVDLFGEYKSFSLNPWNKIVLTYEQHIVAHHILWKAYGGSQLKAFRWMVSVNGRRIKNLKVLRVLREQYIEANSGINHPNYGKPGKRRGKTHTAEAKEKNRIAHTGIKQSQETIDKRRESNKDFEHSEESKEKIRQTLAGVKHTEERIEKNRIAGLGNTRKRGTKVSEEGRKNISESKKGNTYRKGSTHTEESNEKNRQAHLGKKHTEETKKAIGDAGRGRVVSEETRKQMSESRLGFVPSAESRAKNSVNRMGKGTGKRETCECPHCHKVGGTGMMKRYHFDNCKYK